MSGTNPLFEHEDEVPFEEIERAREDVESRCAAAGIQCERVEISDGEYLTRVGIQCNHDTRWIDLDHEGVVHFSSVNFERHVFLSEYNAICSYKDGSIEAAVVPGASIMSQRAMEVRLFGIVRSGATITLKTDKITLEPPQVGLPHIEIGAPSELFKAFLQISGARLTLKLTNCNIRNHDDALSLLKKLAGPVLFQIDLVRELPLNLERERRRPRFLRRRLTTIDPKTEYQYPKTGFDEAPLALYRYARGAAAMPLLQFLAFYQVVEFYFPTYSRADAHRKLKTLLKDPTFRGDRDADVSRILHSIQVSRSGAFGDERSQLKATLMECADAQDLRSFLTSDEERKKFFLAKSPHHKIPLANPTADLRGDVAERIYSIRCKIVHTKNESRVDDETLLPFSKEEEELFFDIQLAEYLAQSILIFASHPLQIVG